MRIQGAPRQGRRQAGSRARATFEAIALIAALNQGLGPDAQGPGPGGLRIQVQGAPGEIQPYILAYNAYNALNQLEDSEFKEVTLINRYALFMGYLSMAIRGLGFLAITWTTVVLLGGFVSTLRNKDFWCLTMITLLQTAGVYDVVLNEKLGHINESAHVFWAIFSPDSNFFSIIRNVVRFMLRLCASAVQLLVWLIVLCPLKALYMFGLLISMGLSLWRLIEHDFGDVEAHLKPALQVLYSLAVLQGALFVYRFIFSRNRERLAKAVASKYNFGDQADLVLDYSRDVRIGCEKDPTFAKGRNLITYAVDLIKTESPDNYISGAKILERMTQVQEHHKLIKQLIGSTSSCLVLQKLVRTMDRRSPYDFHTRVCAAKIVALLADDFHLEQFPAGARCIISLLNEGWRETSGDEPLGGYNELVEQGLDILYQLAADEDNCKVLSGTHGLVTKISVPMRLRGLHHTFHSQWCKISHKSLLLLRRLMTNARGEAGKNLRREFSSNDVVIRTIEAAKCRLSREEDRKLLKLAMETLLDMSGDRSYAMPTEIKEAFIQILANMIVDHRETNSIRALAGENLEGLCIQCTENGECIQKLAEALSSVMPTVLKEIALPDYLSLCVAIRDTLVGADPHLARLFDEVAAKFCLGQAKPVKTFACLVNESQQVLDGQKKKR